MTEVAALDVLAVGRTLLTVAIVVAGAAAALCALHHLVLALAAWRVGRLAPGRRRRSRSPLDPGHGARPRPRRGGADRRLRPVAARAGLPRPASSRSSSSPTTAPTTPRPGPPRPGRASSCAPTRTPAARAARCAGRPTACWPRTTRRTPSRSSTPTPRPRPTSSRRSSAPSRPEPRPSRASPCSRRTARAPPPSARPPSCSSTASAPPAARRSASRARSAATACCSGETSSAASRGTPTRARRTSSTRCTCAPPRVGVAFARGAVVRSPAAPNRAAAAQQELRWEGGRARLARTWIPAFVARGLRRRDATLLDAAVELALPPLGLLTAAVVAGTAGSALLAAAGATPAWAVAPWAAALAATPLYVLAGLRAAGAPASAYRAMAGAAPLVAAKVLRARRTLTFRADTWVRTERAGREP